MPPVSSSFSFSFSSSKNRGESDDEDDDYARMRQGETRSVFGRWVQRDPAAARAWLEAQTDLNSELSAELARAAQPQTPR